MLPSWLTMDFDEYYLRRHPNEFDDPTHWWHPRHPVWVAHRHQLERTLLLAIERSGLPIEDVDVLEVGCGTGRHLRFLVEIGAAPERLHGIDLLDSRLRQAKTMNSSLALVRANAVALPYCGLQFGLVTQFVAFSSILDHTVRQVAASEMQRVLQPGGWILYYDIVKAQPGRVPDGLEEAEVRRLFTDIEWTVVKRLHGRLLARLARHPLLAAAAEWFPLPKSNLVMVGRKK